MQLTLKEWRKAKGISCEKMAKRLGVSPSTVNNWERGYQKIPVISALKACEFIGISIEDVYFLPEDATKMNHGDGDDNA